MKTIKEIIEALEADLEASDSPKSCLEKTVELIQCKKIVGNSDIYLDCKKFISYYIKAVENGNFGYDWVDSNKIIEVARWLSKEEEKYFFLRYVNSVLSQNGFDDVVRELETEFSKTEIKFLFSTLNFGVFFRLLHLLTTFNAGSIIASLVVVLLSIVLIFYPTNNPQQQIFLITSQAYTSNEFLNNILIILAGFFDFDDRVKILPLNAHGVVLLILIKTLFFLLVANYLFQSLNKKLGNV